jgi:hypothetical protein
VEVLATTVKLGSLLALLLASPPVGTGLALNTAVLALALLFMGGRERIRIVGGAGCATKPSNARPR